MRGSPGFSEALAQEKRFRQSGDRPENLKDFQISAGNFFPSLKIRRFSRTIP